MVKIIGLVKYNDRKGDPALAEVRVEEGQVNRQWPNTDKGWLRKPGSLVDYGEVKTDEQEPTDDNERLLLKAMSLLAANQCFAKECCMTLVIKGIPYELEVERKNTVTEIACAIYSDICHAVSA